MTKRERLYEEFFPKIGEYAQQITSKTCFEYDDVYQELALTFLKCMREFIIDENKSFYRNKKTFINYLHNAFVNQVGNLWYNHFIDSGTCYEKRKLIEELRYKRNFSSVSDIFFEMEGRKVAFDFEAVERIEDNFSIEEHVMRSVIPDIETIIDLVMENVHFQFPGQTRYILLSYFRDEKNTVEIANENGISKQAIHGMISRFCEKARKNETVMESLLSFC